MLLPGQNSFSEKFRSVIKKTLYELDPDVICEQGGLLALLAGLKDPALEAATRSGYAVINADSRQLSACNGQRLGKIIYFSMVADNVMVRRHLGAGGTAVFIREGQVLAATGGRARAIAGANHDGRLLSHLIKLEDALAAAAGLLALGIHPGELWQSAEDRGADNPKNAAIKS